MTPRRQARTGTGSWFSWIGSSFGLDWKRVRDDPDALRCVTWNIAAINNNPFEYYTTCDDDPGYAQLMIAVQEFIDAPGNRDVLVSDVFTPSMFSRLKHAMLALGWQGLDRVEDIWRTDYARRRIVSGFLKDAELGEKRLASMPDRLTNTINGADGTIVCRPSVINNYQIEMRDIDAWFEQWFNFMFRTSVRIKHKRGEVDTKKVCAMLQTIKRSKYPAITAEEEAISIPLQMLALAIFDATLYHIMNSCAGTNLNWHAIKMRLCSELVVHKQANVIRLLTSQHMYATADVICLQEVAGAFVEAFKANKTLSSRFALLTPGAVDHVRDQNSFILVAKSRMSPAAGGVQELDLAEAILKDVPVADGDLCAFIVPLLFSHGEQNVVLASFHGDTAGLASTPVVNAVRHAAREIGLPIVFGLDANTHRVWGPKSKHVHDFLRDISNGDEPLCHCWEGTDADRWLTTFNARTFLQPQLNKAVRFEERATSRLTDANPKDFILFSGWFFAVESFATRDNTGDCRYNESLVFPSLRFPSDHAIVSAQLVLRRST